MAYKRKCTDEEIADNARIAGKLGGRPPKYGSAEELETAIDNYFIKEIDNGKAPTWAGMLLELYISDRTLLNYRTEETYIKAGYFDVIKRAEQKHCSFWQQYAVEHPNLQSFCIFELKQPHNGGFADKQQDNSKQDIKIEFAIAGLGK